MKTAEALALLGEGWFSPLETRPSGPVTVQLEHPVAHGGEQLEALGLNQLRGVHVHACPADWGIHGSILEMAGRLTGLPDVVLDQLRGADLNAVLDATLSLLWPVLELPAARANLEDEKVRADYPVLAAPLELELETPIRAGTEAASRLTFQSITGKLVRALPSRLQLAHLPNLVCGLCPTESSPSGLPRPLFDQLAGRDLQAALGVAQCFFAVTRRSGRGSTGGSPARSAGTPSS